MQTNKIKPTNDCIASLNHVSLDVHSYSADTWCKEEFFYIMQLHHDDETADPIKDLEIANLIWDHYGAKEAYKHRYDSLFDLCENQSELKEIALNEKQEWIAWLQLLQKQKYPPSRLPTREEVKHKAKTVHYIPKSISLAIPNSYIPSQILSLKTEEYYGIQRKPKLKRLKWISTR